MFHLYFGGISSTLTSSKSGGTCSTSTSDRNGTFWCFQNVLPFSNHQFSHKIKLFCIENRIQWSKRQILIDSGTCSTFAFSKISEHVPPGGMSSSSLRKTWILILGQDFDESSSWLSSNLSAERNILPKYSLKTWFFACGGTSSTFTF